MTAITVRLNKLSPRSWLKRLGLFIVGLWVIILIAAIGSLIYQKIDGPTIQSVTASNLSLEDQVLGLNYQLNSSRSQIDSLRSQLSISSDELSASSAKLDAVVNRIEGVEEDGERLIKLVERFVEVVPWELPPHDLRLNPAGR